MEVTPSTFDAARSAASLEASTLIGADVAEVNTPQHLRQPGLNRSRFGVSSSISDGKKGTEGIKVT